MSSGEDARDSTPETADVEDREAQPEGSLEFYGGKWLSLFPLTFFVIWAIVQSGLYGIADTGGLVAGMLLGLIFGMLFAKGNWKTYADTVFEGMTRRVAATAIVAWLWAGMFAATIQAGGFVDGLVWAASTAQVGPILFPAITFLLAGLLATGIGTGYGTTIAFTAFVFPVGVLIGANPVLMFGAILSGAVFGDNLAPVSDTTIVSAVTQDSDIGGVVASRFKYAVIAATGAIIAYIVAGVVMPRVEAVGNAQEIIAQSEPLGLVHLLSMGIVIVTAVRGRHIIEAISWGIIVAAILNVALGLAAVSQMVVFRAARIPAGFEWTLALPFVERAGDADAVIAGSIYEGALGFFPLIVLTLLIVSGAQIMIRGGGFEAIQDWMLSTVATNVSRAETTMVGITALINASITINTAAEIAIAPYISRIGEQFNINGYRRANILDANTAALGYIFPWSGGVLVGWVELQKLPGTYDWFEPSMLVNPVDVWPYVFYGWLLVAVFLFSAWSGFGREYTSDRETEEVARV